MNPQRVVIRGKLPNLNDMIGDARTHWSVSAKAKRVSTRLVELQCAKMKRIASPCTMSFEWHTSTRHDPDNISSGGRKSCLDGMVEAGKLPNDNQKWILGFEDTFYKCPKGEDKVIVSIVEYPE